MTEPAKLAWGWLCLQMLKVIADVWHIRYVPDWILEWAGYWSYRPEK